MTGATDKLSLPDIDRNVLATLAQRTGVQAVFEVVAEVDSTQTQLLNRAATSLVPGLTLVADHQTAGRGRLARGWETQPGEAVMMSTVLRVSESRLVPVAVGVAVAQALRDVDPDISLKWPNDIVHMVAGSVRKIGGIIAGVHPDDPQIVVVGIGINIALTGARPSEIAAALGDFVSPVPSRAEIVVSILREIQEVIEQPREEVLAAYRQLCGSLQRSVRITGNDGAITVGTAVGIDADGRLIVSTSDGETSFDSGDVEYATLSG